MIAVLLVVLVLLAGGCVAEAGTSATVTITACLCPPEFWGDHVNCTIWCQNQTNLSENFTCPTLS